MVKKVNADNKKRESRIKIKQPRQNYAQIDLRHNSEISDFLMSTENNKIRETSQENFESDKIIPFNFNFGRLNVAETVENDTKGKYIENNYKTGKAKKVNERMTPQVSPQITESPRRRKIRIKTLEGDEVSTSSINITDQIIKKKVMPKNEKITKVNKNLS